MNAVTEGRQTDSELLTPALLADARKHARLANRPLLDVLEEQSAISPGDFTRALAELLKFPWLQT